MKKFIARAVLSIIATISLCVPLGMALWKGKETFGSYWVSAALTLGGIVVVFAFIELLRWCLEHS